MNAGNVSGPTAWPRSCCTVRLSLVFCDQGWFWHRVAYSQGVSNIIPFICHGAGDSRKLRNVGWLVPAYETSQGHSGMFTVRDCCLRDVMKSLLALKSEFTTWTCDINSDWVTPCSSTWQGDMKQELTEQQRETVQYGWLLEAWALNLIKLHWK